MMQASCVPVDVNFPFFRTFLPAFKKFESDLSIPEDVPILTKDETVAPNSTSVHAFLCIFTV